jgi:hypothetical protein
VAINRCARRRKKGQEGKEGLRLTRAAGIERILSQMLRTPASDFFLLEAFRAREKRGKGEGT